jgi:hypothetical protein
MVTATLRVALPAAADPPLALDWPLSEHPLPAVELTVELTVE